MVSVSKIAQPVSTGIKSLGRSVRNKTIALLAVAALTPALANARSDATQNNSASEVKTETVSDKANEQDYTISTYKMTANFYNGLAHNVSGNQLGLKIGADYNNNFKTTAQDIGPYINLSGKTGTVINAVYDVDAKAGFDLTDTETTNVNLGAYAALGMGGDIIKRHKSRLSLDVAGEGMIGTKVNKNTTVENIPGAYGIGGRARLTYQQGIGNNTRMTLSANGGYGDSRNLHSTYSTTYENNELKIYSDEEKNRRYLRAGGDLTFDIGTLSLGVYGGYLQYIGTSPITNETLKNDTWGGGARVAFRFGN